MKQLDFTVRRETEADHRAVENLIRESFWNVYRPGCSEHYVIHRLREDPAFVREYREEGEAILKRSLPLAGKGYAKVLDLVQA